MYLGVEKLTGFVSPYRQRKNSAMLRPKTADPPTACKTLSFFEIRPIQPCGPEMLCNSKQPCPQGWVAVRTHLRM